MAVLRTDLITELESVLLQSYNKNIFNLQKVKQQNEGRERERENMNATLCSPRTTNTEQNGSNTCSFYFYKAEKTVIPDIKWLSMESNSPMTTTIKNLGTGPKVFSENPLKLYIKLTSRNLFFSPMKIQKKKKKGKKKVSKSLKNIMGEKSSPTSNQ